MNFDRNWGENGWVWRVFVWNWMESSRIELNWTVCVCVAREHDIDRLDRNAFKSLLWDTEFIRTEPLSAMNYWNVGMMNSFRCICCTRNKKWEKCEIPKMIHLLIALHQATESDSFTEIGFHSTNTANDELFKM